MNCWGCTLHCSSKDSRLCQWRAVTRCKNNDESQTLIDVTATQNPGHKLLYENTNYNISH